MRFGAAVRQPRLRRRDQPRRVLGAARARELADDEARRRVPGQRQAARREVELARQVEERRQQRPRPRPRPGSRAAGSPACGPRAAPPARACRPTASAQLVVPRSMPTTKRADHANRPVRRLRLRRRDDRCGRSRAAAAGRRASLPSRDAAARRGTAATPATLPTTLTRAGSVPALDRDRAALLVVEDRRERDVLVERLTAARVHVADRGADLRVGVRRRDPPSGSRPAGRRAAGGPASASRDRWSRPAPMAVPPPGPAVVRPTGERQQGCRRRSGRERLARRTPERRTSSVFRGRSSLRLY